MHILGISAFYHDAAACLLKDGRILAAAQEERFTRIKNDDDYPQHAIDFCLNYAGIKPKDIGLVAFYDKPFLKFERILESYLAYAPYGIRSFIKSMPLWIKKKLWIKNLILDKLSGFEGEILFPEHHLSHAASAFFPSPFRQAAFLTVDGVGEWTTTSFGTGEGNHLKILNELYFPHSLGLLYSAFTYYTGFKVNEGEYKMMGLAPYGTPRFKDKILNNLINLKADGSFKVNMDYFDYAAGLKMTNSKFDQLFGAPPRKAESKPDRHYMDVAASIQGVTEEIMLKMANHIHKTTKEDFLCLAGGVALNCVANGRVLKETKFKDIWVQPAAGDAGGALGAALVAWHQYLGKNRKITGKRDRMQGAYLGPEFSQSDLKKFLDSRKIAYQKVNHPAKLAADLIAQQKVVGWFQGRMEFGPRALGNRSILGDARSPKMQKVINLKIKFRESFRPFAPSVLAEKVNDYFDLDRESPYMLLVAKVSKNYQKQLTQRQKKLKGLAKLSVVRSTVPAITHVDNSARIQTVHKLDNPLYHQLISTFNRKYDCPVIINTSFNVRGEPIICSPLDAYNCFMNTEMDYLIMGNFLISKTNQPIN